MKLTHEDKLKTFTQKSKILKQPVRNLFFFSDIKEIEFKVTICKQPSFSLPHLLEKKGNNAYNFFLQNYAKIKEGVDTVITMIFKYLFIFNIFIRLTNQVI